MNNELAVLLSAVQEAGKAILTVREVGFSVQQKANNDVVTQADLLANDILKNHLLGEFPNDGWLSEETIDDVKRLTSSRIWIVDPIDGTKEFIAGIPEYALSIALIENNQTVLGCIYNPAVQELYYAIKGQGAYFQKTKIQCRHSTSKLQILASRSEFNRGEWKAFQAIHEITPLGSIAYKLALVAAGKADATFSLGPKNEWDIAAGVLLVQEAGGIVTNKIGEPFIFNRDNVLVDGIVATSKSANAEIMHLIAE